MGKTNSLLKLVLSTPLNSLICPSIRKLQSITQPPSLELVSNYMDKMVPLNSEHQLAQSMLMEQMLSTTIQQHLSPSLHPEVQSKVSDMPDSHSTLVTPLTVMTEKLSSSVD